MWAEGSELVLWPRRNTATSHEGDEETEVFISVLVVKPKTGGDFQVAGAVYRSRLPLQHKTVVEWGQAISGGLLAVVVGVCLGGVKAAVLVGFYR
jgi:hypothetical protein